MAKTVIRERRRPPTNARTVAEESGALYPDLLDRVHDKIEEARGRPSDQCLAEMEAEESRLCAEISAVCADTHGPEVTKIANDIAAYEAILGNPSHPKFVALLKGRPEKIKEAQGQLAAMKKEFDRLHGPFVKAICGVFDSRGKKTAPSAVERMEAMRESLWLAGIRPARWVCTREGCAELTLIPEGGPCTACWNAGERGGAK